MATIRRFFNPLQLRYEFETVPEVIPTANEQLESRDCHILEIHLNNNDQNAAHTVTMVDGSGIAIVPTALSVTKNGEYIQEFSGRLCPGGINWLSSDGASIVGYARWF